MHGQVSRTVCGNLLGPVLGAVIAPELMVLLSVFIIVLAGIVWIAWMIFRR